MDSLISTFCEEIFSFSGNLGFSFFEKAKNCMKSIFFQIF